MESHLSNKIGDYQKSHLSVEEISIHFGGLRAVDGVTFAVQLGQIHGLIGPNGAGKTTIFNCVTGFYQPTHGRICFQDRIITHLRPDQIARLGIARTFQNVQLFRGIRAIASSLRQNFEKVVVVPPGPLLFGCNAHLDRWLLAQ
jgi:ABC-type branched-subunit amino acid transport system ATPase component